MSHLFIFYGFTVFQFRFGSVQITYMWPPLLSLTQLMVFDTEHVNVGQNCYISWFSGLVLVYAQILNALAKTVPMIPHTTQMDLNHQISMGD